MNLQDYFREQNISDELSKELGSLFKIQKFTAGETILSMGENTQSIYLILEGLVRGFYLDEDGNDITKCFSKEGEWCGFYNFIQTEPMPFYVEALEDCSLAQITAEALQNLLENYPSLHKKYMELIHGAFLQTEEKSASFQKMDARERYLVFIEKYPEICMRAKQEHIASYLGITPSSLSRIKRGL